MAPRDRETQVVNVIFCGSNQVIKDTEILSGFLYQLFNTPDENQKTLGFNGCGITHGTSGKIFGTGIYTDCENAKKEILKIMHEGKKVVVNCFGNSRGGVAALLLAKSLGNYASDFIEVNLAMYDPVPGNYIFAAHLDFMNAMLANQVRDLSACRNLKRVLALYPNKPTLARIARAPIMPIYPKGTDVRREVVSGSHSKTLKLQFLNNKAFVKPKAAIVFTLIIDFFLSLGARLNPAKNQCLNDIPVNAQLINHLKTFYEDPRVFDKKKVDTKWVRDCHSAHLSKIVSVNDATYLNFQDKMLREPLAGLDHRAPDYKDCHLKIVGQTKPSSTETLKTLTAQQEIALLKKLIDKALNGMSTKSRFRFNGKGECLKELDKNLETLKSQTDSTIIQEKLEDYLRELLHLCLQRDRMRFSLFSNTSSGELVLALLNSKKFKPLAKNILGTSLDDLKYSDLRHYVAGENNKAFFHSSERDNTYRTFLNQYRKVPLTPSSSFKDGSFSARTPQGTPQKSSLRTPLLNGTPSSS